jgi:hypothetical protein
MTSKRRPTRISTRVNPNSIKPKNPRNFLPFENRRTIWGTGKQCWQAGYKLCNSHLTPEGEEECAEGAVVVFLPLIVSTPQTGPGRAIDPPLPEEETGASNFLAWGKARTTTRSTSTRTISFVWWISQSRKTSTYPKVKLSRKLTTRSSSTTWSS